MNDRRRLLLLSVLVLAITSTASVAITAWQFTSGGQFTLQPRPGALGLALGTNAVLVFAAGTLLLRIKHPFLLRLEASEARTRAIVETAADGIITTDAKGIIQSFNPASEQLFGYRADEVVGLHVDHLILSPEPSLTETRFAGVAAAGGTQVLARGLQGMGRRRDGASFPLELSVGAHGRGRDLFFAALVRDITDRKQAEDQTREHLERLQAATESMRQQTAELTRVNRELDDFTHTVSHDLKEPLRGISSYCGLLLEEYQDKLDDNAQRMMGTLVALCQRLGQMIDDLLTYSRMGRSPDLAEVDLDEVLDDALQTLGPAIDGRGGTVTRIDRLPCVQGDAAMLGAVLQNLIGNGLKFNDNPTPTVEIGCLPGESPTIFVRDNGIGIAKRHQSAVFAMFRRLHGRQKYEGAGAGLSIVRKVVEAHGGEVWLESEPGAGSTFYFTVGPRSASQPMPAPATPSLVEC